MDISSCYQEYLDINLNIQSEMTKRHYEVVLRDLRRLVGSEPTIEQFSDQFQSRYARHLMDRELSPYTINQRLEYLRALWRHACRRGYLSVWPTSISIPEPRAVPCAWTPEELEQLWKACDEEQGVFWCGAAKGLSRRSFWKCFHLICYWTGERTGAVLATEFSWINGSYLSIPARFRKGRRQARKYWLPDDTLEEIQQFATPERTKIFPVSRASFYKLIHKFQQRAGLDGHRIGPQKMRRTHASMVARYGGDPVKALGHSSPKITEEFYLDPTVAEPKAYNQVLPNPAG